MTNYIAHSQNAQGIEQSMSHHCNGVATIMRSFCLSSEFEDLYHLCGLLHDLGKYDEKFQTYIRGNGSKEPHAIWGALFANKKKLIHLAYPIYGHHAGLPNRGSMGSKFAAYENEDTKIDKLVKALKEDDITINIPDNSAFKSIKQFTEKELFIRLLFSSLVDADSLDTESHFAPEQFSRRPKKAFDIESMIKRIAEKFSSFEKAPKTKLNQLRTEVRMYAQEKANLPQGCFSMTLPTGMGKTLCSINWALHHAKTHSNIKRIVIVLPFISIIDQTAKELKGIFGADIVLEHHSNVIYQNDGEEDCDFGKMSLELATENWDYPIIITTAVQFFESLFSNKRTKCRKLHNLQDSIIIFDEIQTLPIDLAECTMEMLNDMLNLCRCSLLFCTATQPDFQTRKDFSGVDSITPLVKDASAIFDITKRVDYFPVDNYNPQSFDHLAQKVIQLGESALIVCNTKKKALSLFHEIRNQEGFKTIHLSTNMCPSHRLKTIEEIKTALNGGEKLIVCSTQLIEAGVDLDFPIVFRELAPLESIIQSAGRCNREGKRNRGKVFLFQFMDKGQPSRIYETFSQHAKLCYQNNESRLYDADFYANYYRQLLNLYVSKNDISEDRRHLNFENVANKYKIIDNEAEAVFVYKYNSESKKLFDDIKDKEFLIRQDYQRISQYCVNVYDKFIKNNYDKIGETAGVLIWHGAYDKQTGLSNVEENYII